MSIQIPLLIDDAKNGINQIVNSPILWEKRLANGYGIHLGIGKVFFRDELIFEEGEISKKKRKIPQYSLCIYDGIQIEWDNGEIEELRIISSDTSFKRISSKLAMQIIKSVDILDNNHIEMRLETCIIRSIYEEENCEIWQLDQPKTEESKYLATTNQVYEITKGQRRWSEKQAIQRDRWYHVPEVYGNSGNVMLEKSIDTVDASLILRSLEGATLEYLIKSSDMDLFDMGFSFADDFKCQNSKDQENMFVLHAMCLVLLEMKDGKQQLYYGDAEPEQLQAVENDIKGKYVISIALSENNTILIDLGQCQLKIIPADDDKESWRLFERGTEEPHLIASSESIGLG